MPSLRALLPVLVSFSVFSPVTRAQAPSPDSSSGQLSPQEWRDDLHFLASEMRRRHKSLFHTMTDSSFTAAVAALDADIPTLTRDQIIVRFAQIGAMIQDGHSGVPLYAFEPETKRSVPVQFVQYPDGIYIQAAAPEYADAVGGRVVSVDGHGWKEVIERLNSIVSHDPDNPGLQLVYAARLYLAQPQVLHGLGLSASRDSIDVVVEKGGSERTFHLVPAGAHGHWYLNAVPTGWVDARPQTVPVPLAMQHPEQWYWFTYRADAHALYFQFNVVANADSESLVAFAARLAAAMAKPEVQRIVIDVRNNTGGNNGLLRPLLIALIRSNLNVRGRMYCLIGPTTFSAAQNFVDRLESYTETIFVGAPTGANVNSYGDPAPIELPHSHLTAEVSTLWWQDMSPTDTRTAMFPEVAVSPTFADYVAGTDPALWIAMTGKTPPTIEQVVESGLTEGADSVFARYTAYVSDPSHRYVPDPERKLYDLGYRLIEAKRPRDASTVFQVNARAHPQSAYEYNGLGDAYLAAGDSVRALGAYRQALSIHGGDAKATRMIERLSATPARQ